MFKIILRAILLLIAGLIDIYTMFLGKHNFVTISILVSFSTVMAMMLIDNILEYYYKEKE